jgi:hypothetical protein
MAVVERLARLRVSALGDVAHPLRLLLKVAEELAELAAHALAHAAEHDGQQAGQRQLALSAEGVRMVDVAGLGMELRRLR